MSGAWALKRPNLSRTGKPNLAEARCRLRANRLLRNPSIGLLLVRPTWISSTRSRKQQSISRGGRAKIRVRICFQISYPNRTQPTVPSPDQMAYATLSGMYLSSKRHADKPLGQTGCSTVAVHGVRRHPGINFIIYVLPANQLFLRADERTRTAFLLITSELFLLVYSLLHAT